MGQGADDMDMEWARAADPRPAKAEAMNKTPTTLAETILRDVKRYSLTQLGPVEGGQWLHYSDVLAALTALRAERDALVNEAVLSKAAYEGVSSLLLSVQQDCIKERQRADRLEAALRLLHDNVVLAFPTLADLGPVANARAALKGDDHE